MPNRRHGMEVKDERVIEHRVERRFDRRTQAALGVDQSGTATSIADSVQFLHRFDGINRDEDVFVPGFSEFRPGCLDPHLPFDLDGCISTGPLHEQGLDTNFPGERNEFRRQFHGR